MSSTLTRPPSTWRVAGALARRSLIRVGRLPSVVVPSVVFPVFQTIAFSGAFFAITKVPGFPTDNVMSWFVPLAGLQGAAFGAVGMGFGAVTDIETGFFDRLLSAPMPRLALVVGPMLASLPRAVFPLVAALVVGAFGGLAVPGGVLGMAMLVLTVLGVALVYAPWALGLAYRIRSQVAFGPMQASIMFVFFLSTAQVPLSAMSGWLHGVARVNPMTNVLRMGRQGFVGDVTWGHTWPGLVVLSAGLALSTLWAWRGLRKLTG